MDRKKIVTTLTGPEGGDVEKAVWVPRLTDEEMEDLILDDTVGWCLACGEEAYGVEPDACNYTCESCGKPWVFGMSELLVMGLIE